MFINKCNSIAGIKTNRRVRVRALWEVLRGKCDGYSNVSPALKLMPNPRDICTTFEKMTEIDEESWNDVDSKASPIQPDFICVCSFDFERNNERYLEQTVSILTKLTKTLSKPLSK